VRGNSLGLNSAFSETKVAADFAKVRSQPRRSAVGAKQTIENSLPHLTARSFSGAIPWGGRDSRKRWRGLSLRILPLPTFLGEE
jgi:hypothetical protein